MPSLLETIMECTPAIRCGTVTFKNAVIRYTIELVHILAIRHGFDAHEAIERLYPGYKNKQVGRYIDIEFLKQNTIRNFKELMLRQPEIVDSNKYSRVAVLSHSHSITANLSMKYNYPPQIYERETFEDIGEPGNPDQNKIKEILRKVVEREDLEYETEDEESDNEATKMCMLQQEIEYLKRENNSLKTKLEDLETDNTDMQEENEVLKEQNYVLKTQVGSKIYDLESDNNDMQEEIDAYKEQNYVLKNQNEGLYKIIDSWKERYTKIDTLCQEKTDMMTSMMKEQNEEMRKRNSELDDVLKRVNEMKRFIKEKYGDDL